MKTVRIKIYKFAELSEKAQSKALDNMREINMHDEWYDGIYEDAKNIGLKITEFDLDRRRYAKGEFEERPEEVAAAIIEQHGKDCETYKTAQAYLSEVKAIQQRSIEAYRQEFGEDKDDQQPTEDEYFEDNFQNDMEDAEDEFLKSLCEDYSIMLQNDYEYNSSDEAVKEAILANEYDFTEDGKQYY